MRHGSHLHQQRRESLDPTERSHRIDLDASFSEKVLEILIGESAAQVPPDGEQDHLRWKPEASERRNRGMDGWVG